MNGIRVTYGRELRAYFFSPLAYGVLASFLFINGITFATLIGFLNNEPSAVGAPMQYFFTTILFWLALAFVGPILPMRLLSEERRSGSVEILMTAPVTETQVVIGKYLAALTFYLTLWAPTVLYAVILSFYSELDWWPLASSYLGVLGIGSLFLSVGLFASGITRNQIVAALVGFAFVFALFIVGLLEFLFNNPTLRQVISYVNLIQHMEDFAKGIVDTRRLVYYASSTVFFLFLTSRALAANKWR